MDHGESVMDKRDLELKALGGFCGSEQYHNVLGFNVTDGIHYIMENGYSYLVTDLLVVIQFKTRLRSQPFLAITFTANPEKHTGEFVVTDGNEHKLYSQKYGYTDAKITEPLKMFLTSGVLMLAGEY